mmetsp:Transcript_30172/g.41764  ORF Transcript_30172/g.41764 Transcript_30172/m.41764 type:complete len:323 (-) Transcript_30172:120-1088(-)|eukprot:CAMPEP_0196583764 /NCGR_PEP_ID=MMETSP1081-20130531/44571_1 /TAXON_ID=36882 /ORGANISM="Pyramimonas amylifera, Strain CCMP720" /LENGTH=322 /DNA_ID=CAMNT_0041904741 /DNA_START=345 /DNA_END=1313 /DNA_ORIENTATION=-
MANKYGLFSEPTYNSIGDPFVGKDPVSSRLQGLNFKATLCKRGDTCTRDTTFDPLRPLFEGEKYMRTREELKDRREENTKKLASEKPFRPSNPNKKSSGLGGYYGTLGSKMPHLPEYDPAALSKKKGDFEVGPRNIQTCPSKKGTFGMNKTTLGEKISIGGAVGEYQYKPTPYDAPRTTARDEAKAAMEKRTTDKPFKPSNPSKRGGYGITGTTLGGKGHGVCSEYAYVETGPHKRFVPEVLEKPFRPSNPPKLGYNRTINKFPPYQEDPLEVKLKIEREERLAEATRMANVPRFVPPNTLKGGATPSVLRKNIVLNFAAST